MEGQDAATTPWYKRGWVGKVKKKLQFCWRQPTLPVKEFGPAPVRFLPIDVGGLRFRVWREATLDWTKSLCCLFLSADEKEQAVAELSTAKVDSTDDELLERAALVVAWKSEVRPPALSDYQTKKSKSKSGIPGLPRIQSGIPMLSDADVSDVHRLAMPQAYVDLQRMDLSEHREYAECMC
jgi:hypothetical protein